MRTFDGQPTLFLFELLHKPKVSSKEAYKLISGTPLQQMFTHFNVGKDEQLQCLSSIFEKSFNTDGLSEKGAYFISYIHKVVQHENEIIDLLGDIFLNESHIVMKSKEAALEYLQKNTLCKKIEVLFVPVPYDSRVQGGRIYFDPLLALDIGKEGLINVLSHEFHHVGNFSMRSIDEIALE